MMKKRKKILVMTYAVSPYRGSEYSVAWNYITFMSKYHDLTVLYGMSDNHMGDNESMQRWLLENELPHVRFVYVTPSKFANWLNWFNRHDILVYTFYFAFQIWQKCAYKMAQKLMQSEHFDLIHNVGPIGYREPGYLWKLGLPYVWGPIGGANNSPESLMKYLPVMSKLKHRFRTFANSIQLRYNPRLTRALKATDALFTATSENQQAFKKLYKKNSICIPENCINGNIHLDTSKFENIDKYRLLIVGRIDPGKNIKLFLDALTLIMHKQQVCVDIVGDGPLKQSLSEYAQQKEIDNLISWHGQLPRDKVLQMYDMAHLHIITSISEGNPTTIWEAMVCGTPTLSFDHCGMHDTLKGGAGILIPISPTYDENVERIANAIDYVVGNATTMRKLADNTVERAKQYTWERRCNFWNDVYEQLLNERNK